MIGRVVARLTICLKRRVLSTASVNLRYERTRAHHGAHRVLARTRARVLVSCAVDRPPRNGGERGAFVCRARTVISCG